MNRDADIIKWQPMMGISVGLHLFVFAVMVFLPGFMTFNSRSFPGAVYEVDLVALSVRDGKGKGGQGAAAKGKNAEAALKADRPAKRITEEKAREEEPVKIAKLSTIMKDAAEKDRDSSSAQLIRDAIAKIEKQAKAEKQAKQEEERWIDEAIAGLKNNPQPGSETGTAQGAAGVTGSGAGGAAAGGGLGVQIYQSEVEHWIFSKWSYPVALSNRKDLAAVVELLVKANGSIEKTSFIKRSGNPVFDASVLKAVERANPLPPFPEGLRKSDEEFEIKFDLTKVPQ